VLLEPSASEEWRPVYRLLTALIQPRPIAWVSTLGIDGTPNLAPFSFFNVVCAKPPTVVFCPMLSGPSAVKKDTVKNIEDTNEFVIQVVSRNLAEKMNLTSCEVASDVDEFELAGLTQSPSRKVKAPRVAEAGAFIECRLNKIIPVGEGSGAGCLILGEVLCIEIKDDLMMEGDRVSLQALDPIGRLSGSDYCGISDRFSLERPTPEELSRPGRP
jgi:flavin reductase (DIM6/NTAB) family NADH-FMN oxidoreductase RutF